MWLKKLTNSELLLLVSICAFKVLICGFFSSAYRDEIFLPFVTFFVKNFQNPWDFFSSTNHAVSFPYPPLMLYILSPFTFILEFAKVQNHFINNVIFSIPLFIADLVILKLLLEALENIKKIRVIFLYYFNPIIIYSTYMHGQLDLIPTVLTLSSVLALKKSKIYESALFLGLALATKFHVIMLVPFFMIYIYKKFQNEIFFSKKIALLYINNSVSLPNYLFAFHF